MARKLHEREKVELVVDATDNVFADLKVPNPDDELVRCELALYLRQVVKVRRLTRKAAAVMMEIELSEAAVLWSNDAGQFSRAALIGMLKKLGYDVRVVVVHQRRSRAGARTRGTKEPSLPPRTRAARA
jgi:predicted XRE-type DNA-binding protein